MSDFETRRGLPVPLAGLASPVGRKRLGVRQRRVERIRKPDTRRNDECMCCTSHDTNGRLWKETNFWKLCPVPACWLQLGALHAISDRGAEKISLEWAFLPAGTNCCGHGVCPIWSVRGGPTWVDGHSGVGSSGRLGTMYPAAVGYLWQAKPPVGGTSSSAVGC